MHLRSGRQSPLVAPVQLAATVVTLAFGGSAENEQAARFVTRPVRGHPAPAATNGIKVICGISTGCAASRHSGLRRALQASRCCISNNQLRRCFPALVAGIVAHLVCGVRRFRRCRVRRHQSREDHPDHAGVRCSVRPDYPAAHGSAPLVERGESLFSPSNAGHLCWPLPAASALVLLYLSAGDAYRGLGTDTINGVLACTTHFPRRAFLLKSSRRR